jgi:hypothetical protein
MSDLVDVVETNRPTAKLSENKAAQPLSLARNQS